MSYHFEDFFISQLGEGCKPKQEKKPYTSLDTKICKVGA